jgi:hypothetical protein
MDFPALVAARDRRAQARLDGDPSRLELCGILGEVIRRRGLQHLTRPANRLDELPPRKLRPLQACASQVACVSCLHVYGRGEDSVTAFTAYGIEF